MTVADCGIKPPPIRKPDIDIYVDDNIEKEEAQKETPDPFKITDYRIIGELFGTYILIEAGEKFILIDKHAAHERLIYDRLKADEPGLQPQMLLQSIIVSLGNSDYQNAVENLAEFEKAGFEAEDFGEGRLVVRAVPTILIGGDIEGAVTEIAEKLPYFVGKPVTERMDDIYHMIACRAAIKAHDRTTAEEMAALALDLEEHPEARYCPHGRPISVALTRREIEKNFGRIR